MIKAVVGFKIKEKANIEPVLKKTRANAMTYAGYLRAENLVKQEGDSIIILTTMWDKDSNFKAWHESKLSQSLYNEIELLLEEKPRVNIYYGKGDSWR